jgi:FtsP/CotA-like multicopper oxidase with cupredoxin domain
VTPEPISRRRALALLALGSASSAVGATGWITGLGAPGGSRLSPADTGQILSQPEVMASSDGVLDVRLTAAAGVRLAGHDTTAWGFNGTSPGPTLRLRPGDVLRLQLVNRLDQPTNLHTHGLHVSPHGNGDNPFVTIRPGDSFDYTFHIPANQPAGTFWYHPHHHGTVADQIFAGLVGALLVEGEPDLQVTGDLVLLVTDTTLDGAGRVTPANRMAKLRGREGDLVLVNGQHEPVIAAVPGAVQRWRVINGCTSRVIALRMEGHQLTQIAIDGAFLPAPVDRDQVVVAPGNRTDLLVRPTGNGRYALVSDPYDRGSTTMMGDGGMGMGGDGSSNGSPVTLATMTVSGPVATSPSVPTTLPAPPVPQAPAVSQRRLTFAMGMADGMGAMTFTIDGRTFDPGRDDQTVALGSTEEWTVVNTSPMDHPFHLHAWPFHVLDASAGTPPTGVQQDVVLIRARGWVRLRIAFTDYPGRSVYHCHILDHEDLGMMGTINVHG